MSLALPPATKYTWRQAPWIPKGERINSNSPTHPCSYNLMHHISHCRDQTAAFLEGQTDQDSSEATCNWQHFYSVLTSKDASRNLFPLGTEIQTKICLIQRLGKNKQTFGRALSLKTAHVNQATLVLMPCIRHCIHPYTSPFSCFIMTLSGH